MAGEMRRESGCPVFEPESDQFSLVKEGGGAYIFSMSPTSSVARSTSVSSSSSRKIRVVVLYGGRSGEHEVSLRSAASVVARLDPARFEIFAVGIDKQGRWRLPARELIAQAGASLPLPLDAPEVFLPPYPSEGAPQLLRVDGRGAGLEFDVIFPVLHGTNCEDGTLQGLLELAEVPYVGCGVLASSVGMDKDAAKRVVRDLGLPIVPFICVREPVWKRDPDALREQVQRELGFPVFVKPSNSGSSVGVHKVKDARDLDAALKDAFRYDLKVLIERGISAREIELSVLESPVYGEPPLVSVPGEIAPTHEFYSYEAKYLDEGGARLMIPSPLSAEQTQLVQKLARDVFVALECEGMARVDLFLDKVSGSLYLNEINTLPGFTSISMYPKMWEASGIGYTELLSRLVDLAVARGMRRKGLLREFAIPEG
jgi:D-alanine-D-alanine ligase